MGGHLWWFENVCPTDMKHGFSNCNVALNLFQSDVGSAFEIGDDGIVPSTPTLQISVRTDGFAEAVRCCPFLSDLFCQLFLCVARTGVKSA